LLLERVEEQQIITAASVLVGSVRDAIDGFQLSVALREIWELVAATNRYVVIREPWKLAKESSRRAELETSLYVSADALRVIAELLRPFMPGTAERTLAMLGQTASPASWADLRSATLEPGSIVGDSVPLFPRIDLSVEALREMSNEIPSSAATAAPTAPTAPATPAPQEEAVAAPSSTPASEPISIDDFMKVDLRVAVVLAAERVPKSKKLLKLVVETGFDQRTIVAGIAEAYEPEALVGRTIAIVFNLKPAKLMGIESCGMVLAGCPEGGKPTLVSFEEPLAPGSRIR
jgi:methionyl-tRNA synthetase